MPQITFKPSEKKIEARKGDELINLIKDSNIEFDLPCGGKGTCGKCIVKVESGNVDSDSFGKLSRSEISDGYICACRTKILNSDLIVSIPDQTEYKEGKFSDAFEDVKLIQEDLFPTNIDYNPLAVKWLVQVPPPEPLDGFSDIDRLTRQIQNDWGPKEVVYPLSVIRSAADIIRKENGAVTIIMIIETDRYNVIGLEPGNTTTLLYGIAVDIGTTTVAVQLIRALCRVSHFKRK